MSRSSRALCVFTGSVLIGACALALVTHGPTGEPPAFLEMVERDRAKKDEMSSTISREYAVGDAFTLTGIGSSGPDYESFRTTYLSTLGWVGDIDIRVSHFKSFPTAEDTGIPQLADFASNSNFCYAVVTVEMTNVNAVSSYSELAGLNVLAPNVGIHGSRYSEELLERSDSVDTLSSTLIFSDSTVDQDATNDPLAMNLPPGESRTMTLCFEIAVFENTDGECVAPCALYFGDVYNIGHCRVDLGEVGVA